MRNSKHNPAQLLVWFSVIHQSPRNRQSCTLAWTFACPQAQPHTTAVEFVLALSLQINCTGCKNLTNSDSSPKPNPLSPSHHNSQDTQVSSIWRQASHRFFAGTGTTTLEAKLLRGTPKLCSFSDGSWAKSQVSAYAELGQTLLIWLLAQAAQHWNAKLPWWVNNFPYSLRL